MFKPSPIETDLTLDNKVVFLNSVFLFAGIVAFGMGFFRWQSSVVLGSIDFVFSLCSFTLVYYLNNHKERVASIGSIALALSYCLFTAIYLLAPYNTSRLSLFFLLSASAFFLKGRQAGLAWLIFILLTIVVGHFLPGFDTAYSHIDIVTTSLYLLALFFIFINYEKFKEKVNERDRDKEVLRLSEERFRTMVENGNDIISIISNTGMVRFISPSVEPVLGFEPSEMINKYVNDLIHPDEQSKAATVLANALAHPGGETLERYEFRMKHKDGNYRDIEMVGRNLISNPVIGGIVLNGRDITERKRNEEKLRTLSTAVEQSPLSVVITDLDATIQYVNPHFTNATGYSREEVIGQNPRILQSGQTPKETYVELWNALTNGKVWRGELVNKRKNGELYWEEAHIAPVVNAAGATTHYVAVKLEITQRKRSEEALRESESRYRLLVESSPFCIHEIDLQGRFQSMNKAGLDMLGLDDDRKVCDMPYLGAVGQQDAGRVSALLRDAIINGIQSHFEFAGTGDVSLYFKSCFIPIKDTSGKVLKLMGITEDITGRKLGEKSLRQSEASQSAILNNSPYLVWLKDPDGRYLKANKTYADYVRLKDAQQVIGKTDFDLWPRDLAEKYRADDVEVMASRQQKHIEEPSLDGDIMHWVETFKTPVIDDDGTVLGTTGFARDVTERKWAEQALAESESRFREIFNTVSDAIFIHDAATGRIIDVNCSMCEMYGFTREEALACGPDDLSVGTPPYSSAEAAEKIHRASADGPQTFEWLARARDGHLFWVEVTLRFASICGNQRILATVRDITEHKQMEQNLRESEARFRAVAQTANDAIITANSVGNIVDCNTAAELLFGYTKAEINGQPLIVLMPERFRNLHNEGMARTLAGGAPRIIGKSIEVVGLRKDGSEFPLELSLAQWQTAEGQFFTAIIRDITERKQAEEQIHTLAFYDALTQLPNRRLLNDRLEQTMAASKRSGHYGALMFLDLDNFKPLNDTHGHNVGDILLTTVAYRIVGCVRETDTVARFGGDEFVVMLGELDVDETESTAQASVVAEKIRAILAEPYLLKIQQEGKAETTVEHHCAASIGVVVFNSEACAEDIIKWADTAMYQAKSDGRNRICFHKL